MKLEALVYLLCFLTSATCAGLLFRGYLRSSTRLLFWSSICFVFLALNNLVVILDVLVLPEINLVLLRHAAALSALGVLLYGFIWETE